MAKVFYPGTESLKNDEIRLVRLLPGLWGDDIQCRLVYDSLHNARPYHALSYVWGSTKVTRPILLDGQVFQATVNLQSALRHLRHQLQDTLLWVDALCINQTDNEERTHQVQLMGTIYRSSESVLVYLGDGIGRRKLVRRSKANIGAPSITEFFDDDRDLPQIESYLQTNPAHSLTVTNHKKLDREMENTVKVFLFIRTLSWVQHLADLPLFEPKDDSLDAPSDTLHLFETLRQLMHAPYTPWWGRMWVIQEVILPPKVTIICGTVSAPWSMFSRAASQFLHHIQHCCSKFASNLPRDYLHVLKDFCHRVIDIEDLRSTYREDAANTEKEEMESVVRQDPNHRNEQRSLISLLRRFRTRKSSDPRDKVYALLSLVQPSPDRAVMLPDYSFSEPVVYIRAALESVYSSCSLSVLNTDLGTKFRQDLPSWVPDWGAPGDFTHNARMETIDLYDVCANDPVNPTTVRCHRNTLICNGRWVDDVTIEGRVMLSDSSDTIQETLQSWLELGRGSWGSVVTPLSYRNLWRMFCGDIICYRQTTNARDNFRRANREDELLFVTWALLSTRSPFYSKGGLYLLEGYITNNARNGVDLQQSVSEVKERQTLILRAYGNADIAEDSTREGKVAELISDATLSVSEIAESWDHSAIQTSSGALRLSRRDDARRKQLRAWERIPWFKVLEIARPILLKRLGNASNIGFIPKDSQVAFMDHSIVSATKARKLFRTSKGYIGLGPADLHEGDKLFLLKGGRTPYILRGNKPQSLDDKSRVWSHMEVIGDCYVDGLMDSSMLEEHLVNAQSTEWEEVQLV